SRPVPVLQFLKARYKRQSCRRSMGLHSQFVRSRLTGCLFCFFLVLPALGAQNHKAHKTVALPPAPEPVAATTPDPEPPVPLTLHQMPAAPPQVTYYQGKLTIISQNATLGDILHAVHERTGAALDVPGNPTERVAGQMGPGSARDVLAQLLSGSHFN